MIYRASLFLIVLFLASCSGEADSIDCDQQSLNFQEAQSTFLISKNTSDCEDYLQNMIDNRDNCDVPNTSAINFYTLQCPCMDIYLEIISTSEIWSNDPTNVEKCQAHKVALKKAIDTPNCDEDGNNAFNYENAGC